MIYSNESIPFIMCRFKLPELFSYTLGRGPTAHNTYNSLRVLWISVEWIQAWTLLLSACLNFSLIIDLIIMIKYPFSDKRTYMSQYIGGSVMYATFWATYFLWFDNDLWVVLISFVTLYIVGVYSFIYSYRALSKPGISGAARNLVLKRHSTGILLYVVTNFY